MEETGYKNSYNGSRGGNRGGKNRGGKYRNRGRFYGQGNSMGGGGFNSRSQDMEAGGNFGGFYDQASQFGDMYPGNMNQMPRNQWEVSYPINTRYMGYRPENTDYSYFGPYGNPSNGYGGYRGMNASHFDYSNSFCDGYDISQDYGYNDYGYNNYNDAFHMPYRPGGGPFHSRRGNNFPPRGRGRGHFSRGSKPFHQNRQGKKKKKKSQDSAAPKHVFAKKPWFDDAILKLLKEKIKAHKRMKRSPSKSNIEAFKELRKEVRRISRQSYNDYCLKSGLPNKYLEAAKAKRQKAEEAASKAEDGSGEKETAEENGTSSSIDQNENSNDERSEEIKMDNMINNDQEENNRTEIANTSMETETTDTMKEEYQNIQNANDRLETNESEFPNRNEDGSTNGNESEFTDRNGDGSKNGNESEFTNRNENESRIDNLNQNINNGLLCSYESVPTEANQEQDFINNGPKEELGVEDETIALKKEQIIIRQTQETTPVDVNMENNVHDRPDDNCVDERTSYETSESIVS